MLKDIIDNKWVEARGLIAFYPANSNEDDDIEVYEGEEKSKLLCKYHTLREQLDKDQDHFVAMSDFIAPKDSGKTDYLGMFAVSTGFKQEEICK